MPCLRENRRKGDDFLEIVLKSDKISVLAGELKNTAKRLEEISFIYYGLKNEASRSGGCSVNIMKAGENISLSLKEAEKALLDQEKFLNQSLEVYMETEQSVITKAEELGELKSGRAVSARAISETNLKRSKFLPEVEICRLDFSVEKGIISVPKIRGAAENI